MSSAELDSRYFSWLCGQIETVKTRQKTRSHKKLLNQLQETIFVAIVPFDDNRIADAKDLRYEFLAEAEDEQGDLDWMRSPCSMFELFVVLARQLSFEMDDDPVVWFWHLVEVLELEQYSDRVYDEDVQEAVSETLHRVIWRTYKPNGQGGLFPLRDATRDQRKIELWYQLNAYLLEQF